jgi:uncharacterized protein
MVFGFVLVRESGKMPRVWVIGAYRAGEQSQLLALAEALQWPYEVKPVALRWHGALRDLFRSTGIYGIDRLESAPLVPPWPDLVLAAGMRNEPVCRWIREQSGGAARIVHLGRPWANPDNFDLVITTPQYRLPQHERVLQNTLTLHRVTPQRLDDALRLHGERLKKLPAPRIAVIVGGPSGPYAFGSRAAERLARQANALARALGGSLMISSSSRTPRRAFAGLLARVDVPHEGYAWDANDPQNPYYAYLALADRLIVSCDSISMLSEACATGRPVHMFDVENDRSGHGSVRREADWSCQSAGYRLLMRFAPRRLSRDVGLVHDMLRREGRVVWLGEDSIDCMPGQSPDMERAVARVRSLFS